MLAPNSTETPRKTWLMVAAAVITVAGVGALVLASRDDPAPPEPAVDTSPPLNPEEQAAVDQAERYFAALGRGDTETVLALSDPINPEGEVELVRWWGFMARSGDQPADWPTGPCRVFTSDPVALRVDCPVAVSDPVAVALDARDLRWAVRVAEDGTVDRAAEPQAGDFGNFQPVWRAYADYLRLFEPDDYAAACDPSKNAGSLFSTNGLAITGACGQITSAVSGDVVAWIDAGQPDPETTDGS